MENQNKKVETNNENVFTQTRKVTVKGLGQFPHDVVIDGKDGDDLALIENPVVIKCKPGKLGAKANG